MKSPGYNWAPEDGDRHLDISFGPDEWATFFFDELGAQLGEWQSDLTYQENRQRRENEFQNSLLPFPLLARIHEYFGDAFYGPNEVQLLLDECMSLDGQIKDARAQRFLEGMIKACKEALASDMGVALCGD